MSIQLTKLTQPSVTTANFTDTSVSSLEFILTSTQMLPSLPVLQTTHPVALKLLRYSVPGYITPSCILTVLCHAETFCLRSLHT